MPQILKKMGRFSSLANQRSTTIAAALFALPLFTLPLSAMAAPSRGAPPAHGVSDQPNQHQVETAYSIERSTVFSLQSSDGHLYRMMVAWPDGPPPATGWPVLYVLDGEDNFAIVTQTMRRLARASARSGVGDHVIVAVESGSLARRIWDYTPPASGWTIPVGVAAVGHPIGGGDAFLDFLSQQAMPSIAARWSVDPKRQSLLGHSFGGLIGLNAALSRPNMFHAIAAISPSFWYGDGLMHREIADVKHPLTARIYVAAGDKEGAPGGGSVANHYDGAAFAAKVGGEYQILAGQTHGSTLLAGLSPALKFLSAQDQR